MPGKGGRPRASGQVFTIPAVELTFDEATPFKAGYRLGPLSTPKWADDAWLERNAAAYLNAAERRAMHAADIAHFMRWVMVGIMQWNTDQVIRKIRGQ